MPVDCACLIHGDQYSWQYVDNLYHMLRRHLHTDVVLHVFTEAHRPVPEPYVRHDLEPWSGAHGARGAWWNKLQIFRAGHFTGRVMYFDLDVVIVDDITWMLALDIQYFWAIRDWRYLWRPHWQGINSSVMVWDSTSWTHVVQHIDDTVLDGIRSQHAGDQDYLSAVIDHSQLRFFAAQQVQSWRWQIHDGGMDMISRHVRRPGAGAVVPAGTSIVVFHGRPKPHQIQSDWIQRHWQEPSLA